MRRSPVLLAAALALALATCTADRAAIGHDSPDATNANLPIETHLLPESVTPVEAIPPEVQAAADEWPMANRDYANTRSTMASSIDSTSVDRLGIAWTLPLDGSAKWGAAASAPLMADGRVYFQDLMSNVTVLDERTGDIVWEHRFDNKAFGPNGPAIGWGKVFVQDGAEHLVALDLETGEERWRTELLGPTGAHQALLHGGLVYTALSSAAGASPGLGDGMRMNLVHPGTSGFVYAIDQDTGGVVWGFRTVEDGFWGNPDINSGAGVWFPPAIDVETGRVFWATGNPAPAPGLRDYPNRASRPGPNLYSNTMLAFEGTTGELAWYTQARPADLFHHDFQNPPILATVEVAGTERDLVIGSGKMGRVYGFDRDTGALLWETLVGTHENDDVEALPEDGTPLVVYPGFWGGVETPGAYADGVVFVHTINMSTPYTATAWDSAMANETVDVHEGRTVFDEGTSEVVAIDAATGEILWSTELDEPGFGGVTVVNDLLFVATYEGTMHALTRHDGAIVWSFTGPAGIVAWPSVVGDTIVWPAGLGRHPQVLALRLDAAGGPSPRPPQVTGPADAGTDQE